MSAREPLSDERLRLLVADLPEGATKALPLMGEPEAMARELLSLRARDAQLGFAFDPARHSVTLCGTEFALQLLENFRTSSGEDECYQHQRREDGLVFVTRTIGHREQIKLLRACLDARPRTADPERLAEWNASADLVLATTPDTIAYEAGMIEELIAGVRMLRETAKLLPAAAEEDVPTVRQAQLRAAGKLFASLERLDFARDRLFLWDRPSAGTCMKCGCTEDRACRAKDGSACGWADASRTLCSACADEIELPIKGGAE